MAEPNRRGGSGRKKTVIRRIEQTDARHVCFSKRRQGFFSKATDLAVLTGAQVAALTFSPGGKVFSVGQPSVDSVVERFLAGDGVWAGAGEGAADEDKKLEKLHQEFDDLRTELLEVKKRTEHKEEAMAKERAAGDKIAAWVNPNVRHIGDEDMAAFFAALMQVKDVVSERANQVLVEAMQVDVSRKVEVAPPLPPRLFGGSTFEFGSSSGSASAGMDIQFLGSPLQGQGLEAGQQMVLAALPPAQGFDSGMNMQQQMVMDMPPAQVAAAGMDMQQQMVLEMPPAQEIAAGTDMQEMPPAQVVAAGLDMQEMPPPPGFSAEAGVETELEHWLMVMLPPPEFPARLEMAQQGLDPNTEEEEIQTRVHRFQ